MPVAGSLTTSRCQGCPESIGLGVLVNVHSGSRR
jgi:hypothetical protein